MAQTEKRCFSKQEFRALENDGEKIIEGHAAVFNQKTIIGNCFYEVIERGAFDGCNMSDIALLVNHDNTTLPLARTQSGTMTVSIDDVGLAFRAKLDVENNFVSKSVYSSVKRGDLRSMSFAFRVSDEEWQDLESEMPTRRIKRIDWVGECSVCTYPAYEGTDVSISARARNTLETARKELCNMTFEQFIKQFKEADERTARENAYNGLMPDGKTLIPAEFRDMVPVKYYPLKEKSFRTEQPPKYIPGKGFIPIEEGDMVSNSDIEPRKAGVEGTEYRRNFIQAFRTNFRSGQSYLKEASLPDGGYLLPVSMHDKIVTQLEQDNIMRQIGKTITTASEHKISIVATKPAASWVAEGEEFPFSNETFGQISLSAYKLAVSIKVSNELLQDSYYNLEAHLIEEFAKAIATAEEDAFINGDGVNCPQGILPTLATSPSTTIKTASTEAITADDLLNLQYSLKRPYRRRAVWVMSDSTLAQIRKIKDSMQNYIWQPSLTESEPAKIFGQPVYSSPFMPSMGSGNVVVLYGDFSEYFIIGERGQRDIRPLRELFAMSGQTAFLMTERIDSALTNLEAVKALQMKS